MVRFVFVTVLSKKESCNINDFFYYSGSVLFTVGNAEEVRKQGHLKVVAKHLYQQDGKRTPVLNGALDRKMGTCTKDSKCSTCGKGLVDCVGHFGYLNLELPVFHLGYFPAILSILQCVCKTCGALLMKDSDKEKIKKKLMCKNLGYLNKKAIRKQVLGLARKVHTCIKCNAGNGVVKKCGLLKIAHDKFRHEKRHIRFKNFQKEFEESTAKQFSHLDATVDVLTPINVLSIFERISSGDLCFLMVGASKFCGKPTDLILTAFGVPPICIRPSVVSEIKSGTTEDDITMKISEICFLNEVLVKHRDAGGKVELVAEDWDFIQTQCALVINSEVSGGVNSHQIGKKKTGRGFAQRLKGKQGRFRGNLSGKRVDFSGRSVISPGNCKVILLYL